MQNLKSAVSIPVTGEDKTSPRRTWHDRVADFWQGERLPAGPALLVMVFLALFFWGLVALGWRLLAR
ncbi:MAG: hypothetical protein KGK02_10935 [Rhodospirillales bacterium]|nr:hypothetical protein [Rhodospirillales bacterium]